MPKKTGKKQSRDIFIRQEQIPAFETAKKAKAKSASAYGFAKKKIATAPKGKIKK